MYLRISNEFVIPKNEIIGIFDMDNTTVSRRGRDFLPECERNGELIYSADELPKSYVVTECDGVKKVYLSSFSSKILINRAKSSQMLT